MNYYLDGGANTPQWKTFRHNGPYFPPKYQSHNIPIIFNNNKITLNDDLEEKITAYTKYIDTDYINNPRFTKNFYNNIKKDLTKYNINSIQEFYSIDFSLIKNHLNSIKQQKLQLSKEQKQQIKDEQIQIEEPYSFVQIDSQQQKVGNFKIEPPGIFLGRGSHPKIGMWKDRIFPSDVTLNLDKAAPIPKPNLYSTMKWKQIVHIPESIWLAAWKDNITGKTKYIFPSVESTFKTQSDMDKFDLARKLKRNIGKIKQQFTDDINSNDIITKQHATALYLIDLLAIRVGTKKDTKKQADTVGVTNLRVEHISFPNDNTVKLDFLGKDSVRFCKVFTVEPNIFNNLKLFTQNKNNKIDLFDKITSNSLNNYLKNFMQNLSAKVWRTYKASSLFQKELNKIKLEEVKDMDENTKINYLLTRFNHANSQVALLCNHQKNISKNFDTQIDKIKDRIKKYKLKLKKIKKTKNNQIKIKNIKNKIIVLKSKLNNKTKMKNVSLGTSKTNYIDPRIIVAFAHKFNLPIDKLFTKTLLSRFEWALQSKEFVF